MKTLLGFGWLFWFRASVVVLLVLLLLSSLHFGEDVSLLHTHPPPPWPSAPMPAPRKTFDPARVAIVTQLYTDTFVEGLVMLGYSIRHHGHVLPATPRIALYLPDQVSAAALNIARMAGWTPLPVERIAAPATTHAAYRDQFTKLRIWNMTEYDAIVYIDSDCLVIGDISELLVFSGEIAAVGDVWNEFWPWGTHGFEHNFNAGMLVLRPDLDVFLDMLHKIHDTSKYDTLFAEQSFLNQYYLYRVYKLPYKFNINLAMFQGYPSIWQRLWPDMRIIHYTIAKPMLPGNPGSLRLDRSPDAEPFDTYTRMFGEMERSEPEVATALNEFKSQSK